jgi:hypothetical protein
MRMENAHTHTYIYMLLYLPERTLNVRYWFIVIVRLRYIGATYIFLYLSLV